jgi:chromosome segregation ATPase
MDPRPRQPARETAHPEKDLDSTDQLPVLDPTAYEAGVRERAEHSGTWIMPAAGVQSAAEPRSAADDPLQTAVENLHQAEKLLGRRAEQLGQLERALEEARTARAAAEQRTAQLGTELAEARAAAEQRLAALNEELARMRGDAEQRERALNEELAEARGAARQDKAQLNQQLAEARSASARRESELSEQLTQAKAAAERRVHEVREAAAQAQLLHDAESQQVFGAREQALAALQTGLQAELQALRSELQALAARATGYFEQLQSAEQRRALLEGLVTDLHRQADQHESSRAQLAREQERTLSATLAERDREVARLGAARTELAEALAQARAATATAAARASEHEAALDKARSSLAALGTELVAERKRFAEGEQELGKVRGEMEEWAGALRAAQLERSSQLATLSAGEARVRELEARVTEQAETLRSLQSAADAALARTRELESDVHAAEDTIGRLEAQLRGRNARVSELEKANQQWRHTLEEARAALEDTGGHRVLRAEARPAADGELGEERDPAPDGATRLLILADGEREVVHVLGRKTTIGRTPDNDVQIDAKYISRHHAVILAGPAHTIIEDLNSTNGVLVNGRRITRETLKDGDAVVVGRTHYRFAVRRTGEKR